MSEEKVIDIEFNGEAVRVAEHTTIAQLLEQRGVRREGVAVAIGSQVIPRDSWCEKQLNQGDKLLVLSAFCGG